MTPFDKKIRGLVYRYLISGGTDATATRIAQLADVDVQEVTAVLRRLEEEHVLALVPGEDRVWMAHPFSGVPTHYRSVVGDRSWNANCAWDALAILGLMGDGVVVGTHLEPELAWRVEDGVVSPDGLVHMVVPARRFWEDVGYT